MRRRFLAIGVLFWALFAMPTLALPVDWAEVCSSACCPFEDAGSCCCRPPVGWRMADGTVVDGVGLSAPHVDRTGGPCNGLGVGTSAGPSTAGPAEAPSPGPFVATSSLDRSAHRSQRRQVLSTPLCPRPPPKTLVRSL